MLSLMLASSQPVGDVVVAGRGQCGDHLALVNFGYGKLELG